ncbi:MAG: hypothetical protein R3C70_19390 [Geminicoccaceae bacterium]
MAGDARSGKKRAVPEGCGERTGELRRRSGAQRCCADPLTSSFPVLFVSHRGYRHFFNTLLTGVPEVMILRYFARRLNFASTVHCVAADAAPDTLFTPVNTCAKWPDFISFPSQTGILSEGVWKIVQA